MSKEDREEKERGGRESVSAYVAPIQEPIPPPMC